MSKKLDEPMPGQCQCLRCDYIWWPAQPVKIHRPKQCPACKSRYWSQPKDEKRKHAPGPTVHVG